MSPRSLPRASLYVRLSKAAGTTNLSLQGMADDLRAVCAREGFEEVALHVDNGQSGAVRDRPEFRAWLADGREGRADVLLTYHADRLTREGLNAAALVLDVVEGKDPETGKAVRPPVRLMDNKGLDSHDGDSWRLSFAVQAEVARAERERMRDRSRDRVRRARSERRWPGGSPPYGYAIVQRMDGPGKALAPEPREVEVVRWAADEILSGAPLLSVVRRLNADGVPPRYKGKTWTREGLRSVLTGEAVRGHLTLALQYDKAGRRVGRNVLRDEAGMAVKVWEPIISDAESEELRRALAPVPKAPGTPRPGRYEERLLTGVVHCARCGGRMRARNVRRTARQGETLADRPILPVYCCVTYQEGGKCGEGKRGGPVIRADWLEEHVEDRFLAEYGRLPMFEHRVTPGADAERLAAIKEAIGALGAELIVRADAGTLARLAELQAERDALAAAPAAPVVTVVPMSPPRTVAGHWTTATLRERRTMLADYLETVDVLPIGRRGGPWRRRLDPQRVDIVPRAQGVDPDDFGAYLAPHTAEAR